MGWKRERDDEVEREKSEMGDGGFEGFLGHSVRVSGLGSVLPGLIESILVNLSPVDDDTLAPKHRDGFKILMFNGVKQLAS